ncbi:MAG: thiamine pyrophosphate-binding protein [Planktomarina sp.]
MKPLGAQISHMLKDRDVDVIFGIPGVHNQEMYRGIEEAGITHVLARHEQGAGFMADGYARATGKPGIAYVITGPGLCNAMTAMGQAYSDSVSVLVLSSCLDEVAARRGQLHQMLDQVGAGACVCDWSEQANTADAAFQLVDRAFAEFSTKRKRSKHIQVPIAQLQALAGPAPKPQSVQIATIATDDQLTDIAAQLNAAEKPLFIFGGGAVGASTVARDLVAKTQAAVMMSYAGRGVIAPDYPLSFGSFLARPSSADITRQADLVVVVGCELAEVDIWRYDLGNKAPMIRIDIDVECLTDDQSNETVICADADAVLKGLLPLVHRKTSDWTADQVTSTRARWRAEVEAERPGIISVVDALKEVISDDTMIYSDMTQFAYVAKEVWDMPRPGHWHHPSGFGTLGYAMPAAIGGAMGRPGLQTMAIAGDYGFQYSIQELGAAVELNLSLPIILWDNGKLKEIEDSMRGAQIAPNAVIARNPDFVKLAQAYDIHATAPKTLGAMQDDVIAAFTRSGPTLIHVTSGILS